MIPNPEKVREIAREAVRWSLGTAYGNDHAIVHSGVLPERPMYDPTTLRPLESVPGLASWWRDHGAQYGVLWDAVAEMKRQWQADPSWPDEQPQDERDDGAAKRVEAIRARWEASGFRALSGNQIDELIGFLLEQLADLRATIARAESAEGAWSAQQDIIEAERRRAERAEAERDADVRAVAALLATMGNDDMAEYDARTALEARFADRIAELDAPAGGEAS